MDARLRELTIDSPALGEDTKVRVLLPDGYRGDRQRRYPVLYVIPGFSGSHFAALTAAAANPTDIAGIDMLYVVLDPSCRLGHHVFADSENNGPVGQALIAELIPHLEKKYQALGVPAARFLTGHSSGGWSSLWLQVTYPEFFGGVWSTSPDPVDFRDFQHEAILQASTPESVPIEAACRVRTHDRARSSRTAETGGRPQPAKRTARRRCQPAGARASGSETPGRGHDRRGGGDCQVAGGDVIPQTQLATDN